MYVISRVIKSEKGYRDSYIERYSKPSPVSKSPGFIKLEVLIDEKNPDYDIFRILIYWKDKKAFYVWEGSPEHIALHKNRVPGQKPPGVIETFAEKYESIIVKPYDGS